MKIRLRSLLTLWLAWTPALLAAQEDRLATAGPAVTPVTATAGGTAAKGLSGQYQVQQSFRLTHINSLGQHKSAWYLRRTGAVAGFSFSRKESPYRITLKQSAPVVGAGTALLLTSIAIRNREAPLTLQQLNGLDRKSVWSFDRSATYQYSKTANRLSDVSLYSSVIMPWCYLANEKTRRDMDRIVWMQLEAGLLAYGLTSLTKNVTRRIRPFAYNGQVPLDEKLTVNAKESFFSGHTSASAAMSFFLAATFSQYYPGARLTPLVWTYAVVWPAATAYLRYRAGNHYPTDIITGYLVGAASGLLIPKIHQKIRGRKAAGKPAL